MQNGAETLGLGFHPSSAEGEMGLSPWWDGGRRDLENSGVNSAGIKLSTRAHPLVGASGNSYSSGTPRAPLPPAMDGDTERTPLTSP